MPSLASPALTLPLTDVPLVFVDVETTGLSWYGGHRVCELAMVRLRGSDEEGRFESLLNPQRSLAATSVAVHHITPDMLHDAPTFGAVVPEVLALLQGGVLVAHNAGFDTAFLRAELATVGKTMPAVPVLDTLRLARRLLQRSTYSLGALARDLHLDLPHHRAMADVQTMIGLFRYLQGRLEQQDLHTLDDVLRLQRGLRPGDAEPEPPPLIAEALHHQRTMRIIYRSRSTPDAHERLIRPLEVTRERHGLFLRAYCFMRHDDRVFAIDKIEAMELVADDKG